MKSFLQLLFTLSIFLTFTGCGGSNQAERSATSSEQPNLAGKSIGEKKEIATNEPLIQKVSLDQAGQTQVATAAIDRKILKDADITIEVGSPLEAQRQVSSIAGARGGFVVTSESKQRQSDDPNRRDLDITLVIRVPASQFESALEQIRGIGNRILHNKETGQDVTEEFIDLEARIKTQKALEAQFIEIMKQANKVADALEVQRQIADVRTEIERLEGRRRFLDNRASLSTITVNLQSPRAIIVSTSGFGQTVKDSVADSVAVASAIVLFLIRSAIILIPILVLIILPGGLVTRYLVRRAKRLHLARQLESVPES